MHHVLYFLAYQSGDEILSVDGESLQDATHAEAVDIIRKSYNNKSKDVMEIVVIPKQQQSFVKYYFISMGLTGLTVRWTSTKSHAFRRVVKTVLHNLVYCKKKVCFLYLTIPSEILSVQPTFTLIRVENFPDQFLGTHWKAVVIFTTFMFGVRLIF